MTFSGNLQNEFDSTADQPKIFGLPMPTFLGWTLGIVGILGAAAIVTQLIMPLMEANSIAKAELDAKKTRLEQKAQIEAGLKQAKIDLVKVNKQKEQVMSLFANERDLNTLLLDLNQLIERNNAGLLGARQAKLASCPLEIRQQYNNLALSQEFEEKVKGPIVAEAKLRKFKPDDKGTVVISEVGNDAYVQPALVGKLRRNTVEVEFEGNFNQVQSIFRTIERLQPLLIIKDLSVKRKGGGGTSASELYTSTGDGGVQFLTNCQPEVLTTTTFKMDALLPLTPVEVKKVATPKPAATGEATATPDATATPATATPATAKPATKPAQ
jgi:type IV pilus assembly protein PilO